MPDYETEGAPGAPLVVFLHGTRHARSVWSRQLASLAERHRAVAVDLPGHGELSHVPFGLAAYIKRLERVIAAESSDGRAVLIGHSLGAYIAIEYASLHPAAVAGLVVCNASIEPRRLIGTPYRSLAYLAGLAGERIRAVVADRARARAYRSVAAGAPSPSGTGGGLVFKGSRFAVRDILGQRFIPKLRSYPGPILIVNGADDPIFRRDEQAFLAASRDGVLRLIEGAGHVPFVERPVDFDDALRRFLDSIHW